MRRLRWENTHELLQGPAGLSQLELHFDSVTVDQVRREGRIVKGIEPVPGLAAVIIVLQDPLEALDIRLLDQ